MSAVPLRLDREAPFAQPLVGLVPVSVDEANALLEEWAHYLGPVERPFPPTDAYVLDVEGEPIAVATSDGIVGDTSAGFARWRNPYEGPAFAIADELLERVREEAGA